MFGESITLTVNAIAKILKRLDPGVAYSSEYLLRETTGEYRVKIRHQTEGKAIRGETMERHNVELSYTNWGVTPDDGYTVIISTTLRNPQRIVGTEVDQLSDALADWVKTNAVALVGWEA